MKSSAIRIVIIISAMSLALAAAGCRRPAPETAPTATPTPEPPSICRDCAVYGYFPSNESPVELMEHLKSDISWNLAPRRPDLSGMVRIKAGDATVGDDDSPLRDDERLPRRTVRVDPFYLDIAELSNSEYEKCVAERQCMPVPHMRVILDHWAPDRPALLTYKQAERYCLWAGKRLPTEIEWEAAARSGDARPFPWGDAPPTPDRANLCGVNCPMSWAEPNFDDGYAFTAPVDSFPAGDNPLGLRNMSGNVKEWVATEQALPVDHFIARGASWYSTLKEAAACYRQEWRPGVRVDDKGVRCAVSAGAAKLGK